MHTRMCAAFAALTVFVLTVFALITPYSRNQRDASTMLSKLFPSNKNNTPNKLALSRANTKIKTLYAFLALLGVSLLSGCGFKLRNDYELAKQFSAIQISSAERHSRLQKTLSNRLEFLDVKVNQSPPKRLPFICSQKAWIVVCYPCFPADKWQNTNCCTT